MRTVLGSARCPLVLARLPRCFFLPGLVVIATMVALGLQGGSPAGETAEAASEELQAEGAADRSTAASCPDP